MRIGSVFLMIVGVLLVLTAVQGVAYATPAVVPEIDSGMIGSAVTLLVGGYLVLASKVRK